MEEIVKKRNREIDEMKKIVQDLKALPFDQNLSNLYETLVKESRARIQLLELAHDKLQHDYEISFSSNNDLLELQKQLELLRIKNEKLQD